MYRGAAFTRTTLFTILVLCSSAGFYAAHTHRSANATFSFAASARTVHVPFPVYLPTYELDGFEPDQQSFDSHNQIVTYRYMYQKHKSVAVTIQARPAELDTESFAPTKQFTAPAGSVYLVDLAPRVTVAITNDRALILVNSPDGVPADRIEQFAKSLDVRK